MGACPHAAPQTAIIPLIGARAGSLKSQGEQIQRREFHLVHDDEMIQGGKNLATQISVRIDQVRILVPVDAHIGEETPLGVEQGRVRERAP